MIKEPATLGHYLYSVSLWLFFLSYYHLGKKIPCMYMIDIKKSVNMVSQVTAPIAESHRSGVRTWLAHIFALYQETACVSNQRCLCIVLQRYLLKLTCSVTSSPSVWLINNQVQKNKVVASSLLSGKRFHLPTIHLLHGTPARGHLRGARGVRLDRLFCGDHTSPWLRGLPCHGGGNDGRFIHRLGEKECGDS